MVLGRPRKTWNEVLTKDLKNKGIDRQAAFDCEAQRSATR